MRLFEKNVHGTVETDACRAGGLRATKNVSMEIPSQFDIRAGNNINQEGEFYCWGECSE